MESNDKKNIADQFVSRGEYGPAPDDFISLHDIIKILLKHVRGIALFTLAATIIAAIVFLSTPRKYGAEAVLQVVMPERLDEKPDRDTHEANILSHLEYLKSSVIAARVSSELQQRAIAVSDIKLRNSVKIVRPPKTNLLQIRAEASTKADAAAIAGLWRSEYLDMLLETTIQRTLLSIQKRIARLQDDWLDKSSQADQMRRHVDSLENNKLITLSKSIDEGELWKRLVDGSNEQDMRQLADIHFQQQEINQEYLMTKNTFLLLDKEAYASDHMLSFYNEAMTILRGQKAVRSDGDSDQKMLGQSAELYVKMLLDMRDIIALGDPAEIYLARGAVKKTAIVFFLALAASMFVAFTIEWMRE